MGLDGRRALVTGGTPKSTGVYYDDTWNHALLPAEIDRLCPRPS